jgi:EAL domain-containing protein (putative c-di-GMP-specific phosphodiesterase class I)
MTKAEVLKAMGTDAVQTYKKPALPSKKGSKQISDEIRALYRSERINNPFRTETSHTADGVHVEILLYYTDTLNVDGAITDDELTPVVIEGGVLAGWGWIFLDQNVEKYRIELRRQ